MVSQPLVSIIVRTKNEEKWISSCLEAINNQTYKNFEIILVDNKSTDKTVEKAKQFPITLVEIEKFLPGKAINDGIRASKGELLVCLSAHCIPVNDKWLENLVAAMDDEKTAGVYGRQEPMSFTPAHDKRELLLVFGLDKKIQKKDSFFHNANSIFRRDIWERYPFDEKATNIEDRIWGREVIKAGCQIVYEPSASVYHYHGIHQNQNEERCANVVRIIEELEGRDGNSFSSLDADKMKVYVIIPAKGKSLIFKGRPLLAYSIEDAKSCPWVDRVIVSTDDEETAELAVELGAEAPFLRDKNLSQDHVDLDHVYQFTVNKLEEAGNFADLIVTMEVTFPFRPKGFVKDLITKFAESGVDSVLPARPEYSSCWKKIDHEYTRVDEGFIPRKFKEPMFLGVKGLGCATHPIFLREGRLLGDKVGIMEVENPFSSIEVREEKDLKMAELLNFNRE